MKSFFIFENDNNNTTQKWCVCVCVLYYTQENQFCGTRKSQGYSNPFYDVGGIAPATIIADMYVMYIKIMYVYHGIGNELTLNTLLVVSYDNPYYIYCRNVKQKYTRRR